MDACRLDSADMEAFATAWGQYRKEDLAGRLLPPPRLPKPAMEALLQQRLDALYVRPRPDLSWLGAVVMNRDLFADVGFYNSCEHGVPSVVFKFVVATQNPRRAVFL